MAQNTSINLDQHFIDALRRALITGEQSGAPEEFDFDAFIAAQRA